MHSVWYGVQTIYLVRSASWHAFHLVWGWNSCGVKTCMHSICYGVQTGTHSTTKLCGRHGKPIGVCAPLATGCMHPLHQHREDKKQQGVFASGAQPGLLPDLRLRWRKEAAREGGGRHCATRADCSPADGMQWRVKSSRYTHAHAHRGVQILHARLGEPPVISTRLSRHGNNRKENSSLIEAPKVCILCVYTLHSARFGLLYRYRKRRRLVGAAAEAPVAHAVTRR